MGGRYVVIERKRQHGLVMPRSSGTSLGNPDNAASDDTGIDHQGLSEASENSVSDPELQQMEDIDTSLGTPSYGQLSDGHMVSAPYPDNGSSIDPSLSIPSPFADLASTDPFSGIIPSSHQEPATANGMSWDDNPMDMNLLSTEQLNMQDFSGYSCVYSDASFLLDSSGSSTDQTKPDDDPIHRNTLILEDVQPAVLGHIMDVLFRCRAKVKMRLVSGDV